MKYSFLFVIFVSSFTFAQTLVLNDKLLAQITKNSTVRIASDKQFFNSYEKQRKIYDDINNRLIKINTIHDYIYLQLRNVNSGLRQGKMMVEIYKYLHLVGKDLTTMLEYTAQNPEYAVFINKSYINFHKHIIRLETDIQRLVLEQQPEDLLMDFSQRQKILQNIYGRIKSIHWNILYINSYLKRAKNKPYLLHINALNGYYNVDKSIVERIMRRWKYLTQ